VTIPMLHGVDSLNVAAASAVALWALRVPPTAQAPAAEALATGAPATGAGGAAGS
jgi:hypothetical protein